MEAKYFATFALLFVVAAVFVSKSECSPVPIELEDQANMVDANPAPSADMKAPLTKGQRQGRFYPGGYGYPGYGGYGGMGYGGSSATAVASASASSGGGGYGGFPYGK